MFKVCFNVRNKLSHFARIYTSVGVKSKIKYKKSKIGNLLLDFRSPTHPLSCF